METEAVGLRLRTIKKLSAETGASQSFIKQLLRDGRLKRYHVNTATYVSLTQFEQIAEPETAKPTTGNFKGIDRPNRKHIS